MLMVPDRPRWSGRWPGTSTTPGWISSLTCSTRPTAPRSLNSRTSSPSLEAALGGLLGMQHAERLALAPAQEADARNRPYGPGNSPARSAGAAASGRRRRSSSGSGSPVGHRREALLRRAARNRIRACPTACGIPARLAGAMLIGPPANTSLGSSARDRPVAPRNNSPIAASGRHARTPDRRGPCAAPIPAPAGNSTAPRPAASPPRGAYCMSVGAVGAVDILGFEIGRRRQHDIGVARRHRRKGRARR